MSEMSTNKPVDIAETNKESVPEDLAANKNDSGGADMDWDTDSINPLNWPLWNKAYHSILPAIFGFVV